MTGRLDSFLDLCRCLAVQGPGAGDADRGSVVPGNGVAWAAVIAIADKEMVSPGLYAAVKRKDGLTALPKPVRSYLDRCYRVNAVRNERMRGELIVLLERLDQVGIVPIALKGGVHLFEAGPGETGARMMRDLDLLVRDGDFAPSIEVLRALGYYADIEGVGWTYQYRPMYREGNVASVEIHRFVGEQRHLLTPAQAWRDAVDLEAQGARIMALSPTHRVLHNIFHSQIQDRGQELGIVWLRQLLDLVTLATRHAESIDWDHIDTMFRAQGLQDLLSVRLYQANRLLGLPWPAGFGPDRQAERHHQRCLTLIHRRRLMKLLRYWAGATAPFKRNHIDLMYDCGTDALSVNLHRVRHAWYLLRRYHGEIRGRMSDKRRQLG